MASVTQNKCSIISQQLRQAVISSGLTRYAICKAIDLPESTMSRFMAGRSGISLATIDRLGTFLHLELKIPKGPLKNKGR
jgi:plasmid maintenance system antidote protein VapI